MIFLIILSLFFSVQISFAQEVFKFFEFAPRSQENIVLKNNILKQPFIPFNDYLSIIGFWIENPETATINLKIYSPQNNLIFNKNFTLPQISPNWWGEEFKLPLNQNLNLESGQEYLIVITPVSDNKIKFYAKSTLELLQGSEDFLYFPETLKNLKLNNEEQNLTLKLSLYEGMENSPPIISNLQVIVNNPKNVTISFNSNEPIIYSLEYKSELETVTSSYQIDYFQNCPQSVRNCLINLNVLSGKNYYFLLKATDFWNNFSLVEGSFQTPNETEYQQSEQENLQSTSSQTISFPTSSQSSLSSEKEKNYQNQQNLNIKIQKSTIGIITDQKTQTNYSINQILESLKKNITKIPSLNKEEKEPSILSSYFLSTLTIENVIEKTTKTTRLEKISFINQNKNKNIPQKSKLKFNFLTIFIVSLFLISILIFKNKIFSFFKKNKAFTILEISLILLIISFIISSLFLLVTNISNINVNFVFNLKGAGDALLFFKEIERELRMMQNSNIGNYPIELATSTKIVFYSDIDNDGLVERISYFIEGTELKKSIIVPSGNPLNYNLSTEKILTIVKNLIIPQEIFYYYDSNYQTTTDVSKIKNIKVNLKVYQSFSKNIFENYIIVSPRNLLFKE
jgi:hypothetical protein